MLPLSEEHLFRFLIDIHPVFHELHHAQGEDMSFSEPSNDDELVPAFGEAEATPYTPAFALQTRPLRLQPARVYLESLARGDSQRTMKSALCALVQMMLPDQPMTEE